MISISRFPAASRATKSASEKPGRLLDSRHEAGAGEGKITAGLIEQRLGERRILQYLLGGNHQRVGGERVEEHPGAGMQRLLQGRQAGHADQQRESPVRAARADEPDQARTERLGEASDELAVRVIQSWSAAGRSGHALLAEGPGVAQGLEGHERDEQILIASREAVRGGRRPFGREVARAARVLFGREVQEPHEQCPDRVVDEILSVGLGDASAQGHQR